MRKTIEFEFLGNNYRTHQFAAAIGVTLLCENDGELDPIAILTNTAVMTNNGWVQLNEANRIDDLVADSMGLISPADVLMGLCARVYSENFDFLGKWKPIDIPRRLVVPIDAEMEAPRMDPVISLVVIAGKATLRELEEYYSTEDAFKMYDVIAIDNLNKALGSEAALNEAKTRKHR